MDFGCTPQEIENKRKRLLIYAFVMIGSVFLLTSAVLAQAQGRIALSAVLIVFCCLAITSAIVAKYSQHLQFACHYLALLILLLTSYLLLNGGVSGTGAYWTYSLSMLMVLVVGPKAGLIYMLVYVVFNSVLLLGSFSFVYPYHDFEILRIITTSIALYLLILASEWIRLGSYDAIAHTSESHRQLSYTDPLTTLRNRYGVKISLEEKAVVQQAAVVILDVDRFKIVNDNFGNDAGDQVLATLASLLTNYTKGGDIAARWGGEEFLIVLFNTDIHSAKKLVNQIREAFNQTLFLFDNTEISCSFSAGIAMMKDKQMFERSITVADHRLYLAKNAGRNQVIISSVEAIAKQLPHGDEPLSINDSVPE